MATIIEEEEEEEVNMLLWGEMIILALTGRTLFAALVNTLLQIVVLLFYFASGEPLK